MKRPPALRSSVRALALPLLLLTGLAVAHVFTPPAQAQEVEEEDEEGADQPAGEADAATEGGAPDEEDAGRKSKLTKGTFSSLRFRGIGPALASGRIGDFAVDPTNFARYFVAVASGGVWKTENAGTTYTPVFDGEGSYSIGCVAIDPSHPSVVWVGTGENNSQRSVSFGDGVYKSVDGGGSWKNMGLKESEHIGMIAIDPRDSATVWVAAQGPLWRDGGDRGLYKTTDGGTTWTKVLAISDMTGVNEVHLDPRNPDVVYASSYQRRRHVWTLINGGPESAIHKSTDGGATWRKLSRGLPGGDLGRIGLDISPKDPDVLYAIVEASGDKGGFYRSTNRGETWSRRSGYMTSSPQYYNEIVCDPSDVDRVYALDTFLQVTEDGGRTFDRVPNRDRHVDDHALWINPHFPEHLLVGCDGGVYESYDRGENWNYKENLPITQFYRVSVDDSKPFYYVYGGTQDNNSMGGPSRTISRAGIANEDWFVTVGGDGYESVVDPEDPNIVYSLWQYGGLVRHDRRSGETVDIKPRERPDDEPYRWNWDSPLMISPHLHTRLYFAANRLFRSDDRGHSWTVISEDLTRTIDRNTLPVMGKVWGIDAVAKNRSTSFYGNIVSLTESPLMEGLIYVGTDDGLIQVTSNGGRTWRKIEVFPGVPEMTYVSRLEASRHATDTVYAAFDNHKNGDFKPYVLKSTDRGETWTKIAGDLPERDIVYALAEDHQNPDLLFAGTEFGVSFTVDGGTKWIELSGGLPTIAVRDIAIHEGENDLVLGTFGRSFYILDDYSPLRRASEELFEQDTVVFATPDALLYIESSRLGGRDGRGSQGASFFTAPNPPFGATFTFYRKDKLMTREEKRKEAEKEAAKKKEPVPYPTFDQLRAEDEEIPPRILLTVRDAATSEVIRRIDGPRGAGLHRVTFDLRYPSSNPVGRGGRFGGRGPLVPPGTYTVTVEQEVDGVTTQLSDPEPFEVVPLGLASLPAENREAALAFIRRLARLQRAVRGAVAVAGEAETRIEACRTAIQSTPSIDQSLLQEVLRLEQRLRAIQTALTGDRTVSSRSEPTSPSIQDRVGTAMGNLIDTTSAPSQTELDAYRYAGEAFAPVLADLRTLIATDLKALEDRLERAGAPWTPGRIPVWEME